MSVRQACRKVEPTISNPLGWTFFRRMLVMIAVSPMVSLGSGGQAGESVIPEPTSSVNTMQISDESILDTGGYSIGRVIIRVGDIFDPSDPAEDKWAFRLANVLHINTREKVIQQMILFESGDPYSQRLLEESERLLRESPFLYDAQIRPVAVRGKVVDVEVSTRDVWTTRAGLSFGRSGGENNAKISIGEKNILGRGKSIRFTYGTSVDRTSSLLDYHDPGLFGSRFELDAAYADNSDGTMWGVRLERPFFSLDSHWSSGFGAGSTLQVDSLYDSGEITDQFQHDVTSFGVNWGHSRGLAKSLCRRWTLGFTYNQHQFAEVASDGLNAAQKYQLLTPGNLVSRTVPWVPPDHTESYPWLGFELVEDHFLETRNYDNISRAEDIDLGRHLRTKVGFSSTALGATDNRLIFDVGAGGSWQQNERRMLLVSGYASGRIGCDSIDNLRAGGAATMTFRNLGDQLFLIRAGFDFVHHLDPEHQLLLGGDNGLRGYPLRYQEGDRRFLLTIEQRFFTDMTLFEIANVGAAAFVDVGKAWFDGGDGNAKNELLKNIGVGLRLGMSRTSSGGVIHIDVAFPLDRNGGIESVQWLVSTHHTF